MTDQKHKSWLEQAGDRVSSWASDISAHPYAQIGLIAICAAWFAGGFATDLLTAVLSIMAITLTQMVLNRQNDREADAHRRDVAMHAKLDELLISLKGARNEMAGIEELDEEDIAELKDEVKEAIDKVGVEADNPAKRAAAKEALEKAVEQEVECARTDARPKQRRTGT